MFNRLATYLAKLAALALTLAMAGALTIGLLAASGPVSLAFLNRYVKQALSDQFDGNQVQLEDTVLAWEGWQRQLDVRLEGLRVFDPSGQPLAVLPTASVSFDGVALLRGRLAPTLIEFIGPRLRMVRRKDGSIEFAMARTLAVPKGGKPAWQRLRAIAQIVTPDPRRSLRTLSVLGASLAIEDEISGAVIAVPRISVDLRRVADGITATASAELGLAGKIAFIGIGGRYHDGDRTIDLNVNVDKLVPRELADTFALPELDPLRRIDAPVSGRMTVELLQDRGIEAVAFALSFGAGELALPELFDKPLPFASAAFSGRTDQALNRLVIDDLTVSLGDGPSGRFRGRIARAEAGLGIAVNGGFRGLRADSLARFWPPGFAALAREWVTGKISSGTVTDARLAIDIRPGELERKGPIRPDMVVLDYAFEGVSADYLAPMPQLTEARGTSRITGTDFTLKLDSARVRDLAVSEGSVHIDNLDRGERSTVAIEFAASGPARTALRLIEHEPLRLAGKLDLKPAQASGEAAVRTRLRIPLIDNLSAKDIEVTSVAKLRNFALPGIVAGFDLAAGNLALQVDNRSLEVKGEGRIDTLPLSLTWQRKFDVMTPDADRFGLRGRLAAADLARFGIEAAPFLTGPLDLALELVPGEAASLEIAGTMNLGASTVVLAPLRWSKAPGIAATARFQARVTPSEFRIVEFDLGAGDLRARVHGRYGREDGRIEATIDHFRLGANELLGRISGGGDAPWRVTLQGPTVDLRPFLDGSQSLNGGSATTGDIEIDGTVGQVVFRDQISLQRAKVVGRMRNGIWQRVRADGQLNGGAPVRIELADAPGGYRAVMLSSDAGATAKALGVSESIVGGRLRIDAFLPGASPAGRPEGEPEIRGRLRAADFRAVNAPLLAQLLGLGSLRAMGDLLSGNEGIAFARLEVPFEMRNGTIEIKDSSAIGPAVGITGNGFIDRGAGEVHFAGTLVPSYTINSVLGNIPLIGSLLVGRKGEGVFALRYQVNGSLQRPVVTVNPLSALTPGFLRRFIELLETAPTAPTAPDAPTSDSGRSSR